MSTDYELLLVLNNLVDTIRHWIFTLHDPPRRLRATSLGREVHHHAAGPERNAVAPPALSIASIDRPGSMRGPALLSGPFAHQYLVALVRLLVPDSHG